MSKQVLATQNASPSEYATASDPFSPNAGIIGLLKQRGSGVQPLATPGPPYQRTSRKARLRYLSMFSSAMGFLGPTSVSSSGPKEPSSRFCWWNVQTHQ